MSDPNDHGSGRTTEQLKAAPKGAFFVWCNDRLSYPQDLLKRLERTDIRVVGPSDVRWMFRGLPVPVVVDHAAVLRQEDAELIATHNERFKTNG